MKTGDRIREAVETLISTNPTFEIKTEIIRGVDYRVFKNVPETLRDLLDVCRDAQNVHSDDYLVFRNERWSYEDFCSEIKSTAWTLQQNFGVGKGTPVALAMKNYPEMLMLIMGIAAAGGVVVFLNAWWTSQELAYALEDSNAKLVFTDSPRAEKLLPLTEAQGLTLVGVRDAEHILEHSYSRLRAQDTNSDWPVVEIHTDDDFAVMYSSGTTGYPKGVIQTHRGAISAVFSWLMQGPLAEILMPPQEIIPENRPRHVILIATPLFHVTATHPNFLFSLPAGAKICLMDKWDAEDAVRIIEEERVTRFLGVPTQSADLMEAARGMRASLNSLEFLTSGGAKRPPSQVNELKNAFPHTQIATGWGMTETNACGIGYFGDDYLNNPNAAGRLYPPLQELMILDDNGQQVPAGQVGEITVKSACNMRGYLNKPQATVEVFQNGWLKTGDLGKVDSDGVITIIDRKKNIVIRGGENIACMEVEAALHCHPAVAESCAFSVPHSRLGEVVGAAVHLRSGMSATPSELQTFLKDHIAHFKIPEHIWIYGAPLPRGATDKLDRRGLRDICLSLPTQKTKS